MTHTGVMYQIYKSETEVTLRTVCPLLVLHNLTKTSLVRVENID